MCVKRSSRVFVLRKSHIWDLFNNSIISPGQQWDTNGDLLKFLRCFSDVKNEISDVCLDLTKLSVIKILEISVWILLIWLYFIVLYLLDNYRLKHLTWSCCLNETHLRSEWSLLSYARLYRKSSVFESDGSHLYAVCKIFMWRYNVTTSCARMKQEHHAVLLVRNTHQHHNPDV